MPHSRAYPVVWEVRPYMRTVAFAILLLSIAITSWGQAQSGSQAQANEKVAALVNEFETLLSKGDVERLGEWVDKHLLDDFTCITTDGSLMNKAQERLSLMAQAKNGVSVETTQQKIRIISDTAIFTGLTHAAFKPTTGQPRDIRFRRMDVWVRQNGDWKWAACAGARLVNTANTPSVPPNK